MYVRVYIYIFVYINLAISFITRIHTFIATSPIHMEHKLRKSKEQVIEIARNMVKFARSLGCNDVEFSPEDAGRSASRPLFMYFTFVPVQLACACHRNG